MFINQGSYDEFLVNLKNSIDLVKTFANVIFRAVNIYFPFT